jgi:hypothetical protein
MCSLPAGGRGPARPRADAVCGPGRPAQLPKGTRRRTAPSAALVVVHRHVRQERDLRSPQPRRAPPPAGDEPDVRRLQGLAPGAQEPAQFVYPIAPSLLDGLLSLCNVPRTRHLVVRKGLVSWPGWPRPGPRSQRRRSSSREVCRLVPGIGMAPCARTRARAGRPAVTPPCSAMSPTRSASAGSGGSSGRLIRQRPTSVPGSSEHGRRRAASGGGVTAWHGPDHHDGKPPRTHSPGVASAVSPFTRTP